MLARISLAMLVVMAAFVAAPHAASPVDTANANCVIVLEDGGCTNPCILALGPYAEARRAAGLEDKTPEPVCPM